MAFTDELKWIIPAAAGATTSLLGSRMASNEQNKANAATQLQSDRMYEMANREFARRDQLTNSVMPQIYKSMRIKGAPPMLGSQPAQLGSGYQPQAPTPQPQQGGGGGVGKTALGIAGAVAPPLISAATKALAGGGAAAAGSGAGLTAALPWMGLAGAGALGTAAWLKSQAHHEADDWTQGKDGGAGQTQFDNYMKDSHDQFFSALNSGQLTKQQAQQIKDKLHADWVEYSRKADEFAKGGSDQRRVIGQMYTNTVPWLDRMFKNMDQAIAGLA